MVTGKEDLLQSLVEAYIMEKGTKEFYTQAAAKSGERAKQQFSALAKWENSHMLYIQSLYQAILDDRELLEFEEFGRKVTAPVAESGMPVKDLAKTLETFVFDSEKDALLIAMNIEAKAYNLYKDLAAKARDESVKVIFEEMMAQETKHLHEITEMKKQLGS